MTGIIIIIVLVAVAIAIMYHISSSKRPCPYCKAMMPKLTTRCPRCRKAIPVNY